MARKLEGWSAVREKMTVKEAAERMGVTPRHIHFGLQTGRLPFGTAVKMEGRWSYYISRSRFEKWLSGEDLVEAATRRLEQLHPQ